MIIGRSSDSRSTFSVCILLLAPNPATPRNTVAPASPFSRNRSRIASYSGLPWCLSLSPMKMRRRVRSPLKRCDMGSPFLKASSPPPSSQPSRHSSSPRSCRPSPPPEYIAHMLRVAIAQLRPTKGEYGANVARLGGLFRQLASHDPKVDLLVTPETTTSGYFVEGGVKEVAVTAGTLARDLAEQHR